MANTIEILSLKSGRLKFKEPAQNNGAKTSCLLATPEKQKGPKSIMSPSLQHDTSFSSYLSPGRPTMPVGGGGAPNQVVKIFEDDDAMGLFNPECLLIHETDTPRIYFKIPDLTASKKLGRNVFSVLQCADISAGDLKVISKFGSWDSLVSQILIECDGPMMLWKRKESNVESEEKLEQSYSYEYTVLSSCMVKATFSIDKLSQACNMLHLVKVAKTREIANIKELKKKSVIPKTTKNPSKIREGLPEWVNYIPYRWYSASTRRIIEYVLILYTLLSLLWAIWQLYRHVDFIRSYLKPIVQFIEYYFSMFKVWFQWVDDVFAVLSQYWWNYLKPFLMLFVAAVAPLLQIFKPLRGIVNIIPYIFDPFVKFFNMIYMFFKPLISPLKSSFEILYKFLSTVVRDVISQAMTNPTIATVVQKGSELYIVKLIQEALHGHLDPLKAQVIVIRDLIFKSSRKIYYGIRFIISRIYFVFIFLKRERNYSKEGQAAGADAPAAAVFGGLETRDDDDDYELSKEKQE